MFLTQKITVLLLVANIFLLGLLHYFRNLFPAFNISIYLWEQPYVIIRPNFWYLQSLILGLMQIRLIFMKLQDSTVILSHNQQENIPSALRNFIVFAFVQTFVIMAFLYWSPFTIFPEYSLQVSLYGLFSMLIILLQTLTCMFMMTDLNSEMIFTYLKNISLPKLQLSKTPYPGNYAVNPPPYEANIATIVTVTDSKSPQQPQIISTVISSAPAKGENVDFEVVDISETTYPVVNIADIVAGTQIIQ